MADTFIAHNEYAIVGALGDLASKWPFMIAVAIFLVAALTTSQSAATRTMVPLGLALGIPAGYMIAMWTAVMGVLFLPANGTQIAAAEAGTTCTMGGPRRAKRSTASRTSRVTRCTDAGSYGSALTRSPARR